MRRKLAVFESRRTSFPAYAGIIIYSFLRACRRALQISDFGVFYVICMLRKLRNLLCFGCVAVQTRMHLFTKRCMCRLQCHSTVVPFMLCGFNISAYRADTLVIYGINLYI